MPYKETGWSDLAAQVGRALLARKGASLLKAARLLVEEKTTDRGLDGKLQRGTYSFSLFLELMSVLGADAPPQWQSILSLKDTSYAMKAKFILLRELTNLGLDRDEFLRRLRDEHIEPPRNDSADRTMEDGTFSMILMLQLAALAYVEGMERFVDTSDLIRAALQSAKKEK
ncbi:hypothetical protein PO002_22585 [Cupriavidus necator]|uniref:hypothetical protein n=1 Tax=Cupriavidus necator TaxID=106590 RepID=UPI0039C1C8BA